MTKQELISFIDAFVRNSANDSFTGLRLNTILKNVVAGGIADDYASGEEFEQAIADNPDSPMLGYVEFDDVYTKDQDVVLLRIPGKGVAQVVVDFVTDER